MTTFSRETPYGTKYHTEAYLIYRVKDGKLEDLGLYETRESAEANLAYFDASWQIADIAFMGWGIVDGVVSRNSPINDDDPSPLDDIPKVAGDTALVGECCVERLDSIYTAGLYLTQQ